MTKLFAFCMACTIALALSWSSQASADTEACEDLAELIYGDPPEDHVWMLKVKGVRTNWRASTAFTSFTMAFEYDLEDHGFNTPASAALSWFLAHEQQGNYMGRFNEMFPGNASVRHDAWSFKFSPEGAITLSSLRWDPTPVTLANLECHAGTGGQVVATSVGPVTGFGQNFWTFVMIPYLAPVPF